MNIKNKVIVITGGSQGIGLAIAKDLANHGAKLALIDTSEEGLNKAVVALNKQGFNAKGFVANVAKENDVIKAFADIQTAYGNIHGLINNAGITRDALLVKLKDGKITKRMSLESWQAVVDVNLTGVFLCGREAASIMAVQSQKNSSSEELTEGVIINISSLTREGNVGQTNYSATKAGVATMATVWAKELARYRIRCATVAPGFIETEMLAAMKTEMRSQVISHIPVGRLGQPEDVAHTIRYIFENDFITGRVIEVDGGTRI